MTARAGVAWAWASVSSVLVGLSSCVSSGSCAPSASATHVDDSAAVKAKADLGSAYTQAGSDTATQLTPSPGVIDISGKSFNAGRLQGVLGDPPGLGPGHAQRAGQPECRVRVPDGLDAQDRQRHECRA
jgi:hypothetical protein